MPGLKTETHADDSTPRTDLGDYKVAELEQKLERWTRLRAQRLGLESSEESIKQTFKDLGLDEPDRGEGSVEHVFGKQKLRISPGGRDCLKNERLIQALLDRFGEQMEDFLARKEDGSVDKESFAPRFYKEASWASYTPEGEVDE